MTETLEPGRPKYADYAVLVFDVDGMIQLSTVQTRCWRAMRSSSSPDGPLLENVCMFKDV